MIDIVEAVARGLEDHLQGDKEAARRAAYAAMNVARPLIRAELAAWLYDVANMADRQFPQSGHHARILAYAFANWEMTNG